MAKLIAYVMGFCLTAFGGYGIYKAFDDAGKPPEERRDVETEGVIIHMEAVSLRHQVGVTLNTTYRMTYEFQDESGETHQDTENLTASQYSSLAKGQEIPIMYHSSNPRISASRFGSYRSVHDPLFERPSTTERVAFCGLFLGMGILMIVCCLFFLKDEDEGQTVGRGAPAMAGRWS